MDATYEIRWFAEGTPPDAIRDWFAALDPAKESVRTDVYLHTADPSINVKLREGKAEAKRRLPGGGPVHLAEGVAGRAEHWRKFSYKTKQKNLPTDDDRSSGLWIDVDKTRYQLVLEDEALTDFIADGQVPPEMEGAEIEAKIELTETHLDGAPWWTICVETEGDTDALQPTFAAVAPRFFESFPDAHELPAAQSYGYARWLLAETPAPAATPLAEAASS